MKLLLPKTLYIYVGVVDLYLMCTGIFQKVNKVIAIGFFLLNTFYFLQKQFKMKKKIYLLKQNRF